MSNRAFEKSVNQHKPLIFTLFITFSSNVSQFLSTAKTTANSLSPSNAVQALPLAVNVAKSQSSMGICELLMMILLLEHNVDPS